MQELTDSEKHILAIMFRNFKNLLDDADYLYMRGGDCFDANDLFALAEKLGVDDY